MYIVSCRTCQAGRCKTVEHGATNPSCHFKSVQSAQLSFARVRTIPKLGESLGTTPIKAMPQGRGRKTNVEASPERWLWALQIPFEPTLARQASVSEEMWEDLAKLGLHRETEVSGGMRVRHTHTDLYENINTYMSKYIHSPYKRNLAVFTNPG